MTRGCAGRKWCPIFIEPVKQEDARCITARVAGGSLALPPRCLLRRAGAAQFPDRTQLVGHRLSLLTAHTDIRFGRVETRDICRQRHHLNAVQLAVRDIVADDDRWFGLTDFAADGRIEGDAPYLAAARRPIWPRSPAARRRPLPDSLRRPPERSRAAAQDH